MASGTLKTENMCSVAENIPERLKRLKFGNKKAGSAILMKIKVDEDMIVIDEEFDDCTTEELQEELPDCQPRYLVYSYVHNTSDGRTTYPLFVIYYKPSGCKTELLMRYAGCMQMICQLSGTEKRVELDNKEDFNDEWIKTHFKLK